MHVHPSGFGDRGLELPRANLCGPRVFRPMQLKKWGRQPFTRLEVLGFGTVAEVSKMTLVVASLSIDGLQAEIHLPRMLAQLVRLCTLLANETEASGFKSCLRLFAAQVIRSRACCKITASTLYHHTYSLRRQRIVAGNLAGPIRPGTFEGGRCRIHSLKIGALNDQRR